jgi:nucleotide-binding universal stress UspA family protein
VDEQATIVVGVDGSDCARAALEFAVDEAARRGAKLRVVWAFPPPEYWATAYGMPAPPPMHDLTADLERAGQQMVDEVMREREGSAAKVPVTVLALTGSPGKVLVTQAESAELLILGHRGHGGLRSATLGSVGLYCVLHAAVPVTIVRPTALTAPPPDVAGVGAASR